MFRFSYSGSVWVNEYFFSLSRTKAPFRLLQARTVSDSFHALKVSTAQMIDQLLPVSGLGKAKNEDAWIHWSPNILMLQIFSISIEVEY